jgi:hypothetical protein
MEKIEAELEEERVSLQQAREESQSAENELAAKKKEQTAFLKKITMCEKNMAKKKLDIDKKVTTLFPLLNSTKSSIMELMFVFVSGANIFSSCVLFSNTCTCTRSPPILVITGHPY